jgi:hypothetical protein
MGAFTSDWLALREPADAGARSVRLVRRLNDRLAGLDVIRALDLGTGTGANVRFLRDYLLPRQQWLLVDGDSRLLEEAAVQCQPADVQRVDLEVELQSGEPGIFAGRHLVAASALLDLVSARWLHAMAAKCRRAGAAVLFALTYDGEMRCAPIAPGDAMIRDLVNQHQRTDKGFGPALGPAAAQEAAEAFAALGYHVETQRTPWVLTEMSDGTGSSAAHSIELQRRLINGWAAAAAEVAAHRSEEIEGWRRARLAHVEAHRSELIVGHVDLVAWLPRQVIGASNDPPIAGDDSVR